MTERLGPDETGGKLPEETPPEGVDSEAPPLHIKQNAEEGLRREEQRMAQLRSMRKAGIIEGGTEELKIVAALPSEPSEEGTTPAEPLTEEQKEAAAKLAEQEKRKEQNALDSLRRLGGRRPPEN